MFSSKKSNKNLPSATVKGPDVPSIIAADLKVIGNIVCSGSIEIEGNIEGNVTCENITIRRTGSVTGDIRANRVHIDGEVNGLVEADHVTISETGRVTGMIIYESLSIQDGAYIDGQCKSVEHLQQQHSIKKLELAEETVDGKEAANDEDGPTLIEEKHTKKKTKKEAKKASKS